jgi:uncharacterized protein involved in exopolysaccharide biosynthesis
VAPLPPLQPTSDWSRIWNAAVRYKLLVAGITVGGTIAGLLATRFLPPVYSARATMWIQMAEPAGERAGGEAAPIQSPQLLGTSSGWLDLVRSNVVLEDVVRRLRLYLKPKSPADTAALATLTVPGEVRPGTYRLEVDKTGKHFKLRDVEADVTLQQGDVGDSIGAAIGFAWVPPAATLVPGATVRFTMTAPSEAIVRLSDALRIRITTDGNFMRMERRGRDPVLITASVNALADRLVAVAADMKRERRTELSAILREQRDRAQSDLRDAEQALTRFRVRNAVGTTEGPAQGPDGRRITADPTFASYVDMQVELGTVAHDREAIEKVLTRARNGTVAVDELLMIGAVQRSSVLAAALKELADRQAELRTLRFRYADTHPPVRRLAQQVDTLARYVIPDLGATVLAGLAGRERELRQRSDSITRALRGAPPVALEEVRLARDQANASLLFSNLEQRYNEARLAEVSTLPDIRILEHAIRPSRPVVDAVPLLVLLAFVASLGAGVGGAFLRERADPTIRDPQQVTRSMGLPILGAVPHVFRGNGHGPTEDTDDSRAVEALRGIRLNLQHAYGAAGPMIVTVTSPGRGDGKSLVTANLAQAFSHVGTARCSSTAMSAAAHCTAFALRRRPGLTDVLANQVTPEQVVQSTAHPQLSFIGGARACIVVPNCSVPTPCPDCSRRCVRTTT